MVLSAADSNTLCHIAEMVAQENARLNDGPIIYFELGVNIKFECGQQTESFDWSQLVEAKEYAERLVAECVRIKQAHDCIRQEVADLIRSLAGQGFICERLLGFKEEKVDDITAILGEAIPAVKVQRKDDDDGF